MQDLNRLDKEFNAKVDEQSFLDLFRERRVAAERILDGEKNVRKVSVAKALEWNFLHDPKSATEREIKKAIGSWQELEGLRLSDEIKAQAARVKAAEAMLQKKTTKKAENDLRIGTNKTKKAQADLDDLTRPSTGDEDSWIWPKYHFPGIVLDKTRLIRPFRYLIRPQGQLPSSDDKYNGAYNAQQERLEEVFFWRELLGRHHGFMQVKRFRERQDEILPPGKHLRVAGPPKARKEFEFDPGGPITVPFIWDHWTDPKGVESPLESAAAITCDPSAEIKANGIRRVLTPLADRHLAAWENASRADLGKYAAILADYSWERLRYEEVA